MSAAPPHGACRHVALVLLKPRPALGQTKGRYVPVCSLPPYWASLLLGGPSPPQPHPSPPLPSSPLLASLQCWRRRKDMMCARSRPEPPAAARSRSQPPGAARGPAESCGSVTSIPVIPGEHRDREASLGILNAVTPEIRCTPRHATPRRRACNSKQRSVCRLQSIGTVLERASPTKRR